MPIYEYYCRACQASTDILQKLSEPPATECPTCRQPALIKAISAPAFRLAGSGWYETDFKTGGKKNLVGDAATTASADAPPAPACGTGACGACE